VINEEVRKKMSSELEWAWKVDVMAKLQGILPRFVYASDIQPLLFPYAHM
jgi:hypothetical protein